MNIYAEEGHKVVFSNPNAGLFIHQEMAAKHLTVGETYTVDYTDVGGWSTDVYLKEVDGVRFNSVLFEDA